MGNRHSHLAFVVAGVMIALFAQPLAAAATSTSPLESESLVRGFETQALANGALGFYRDATADTLVVVIPVSKQATFELPATNGIGVAVRVEARPIERRQIEAVETRLGQLAADRTMRWTALSFYFDPAAGREVVSGNADAPAVMAKLGDLSPYVSYSAGSGIRLTSRYSDSPPFWGGAALQAGTGLCTSSFEVQDGAAAKYMLTAGHCFGKGAWVYSPGSGATVGQVVKQLTLLNNGVDFELVGGKSYDPWIYVGPGSGTGVAVKGATDPVIGRNIYCFSGVTSYEKCNQTVVSTSAYVCLYDDNNVFQGCANEMEFSGGGAPQGGDSGGPFYLQGSPVYIRGMVNGTYQGAGYGFMWSTISSKLGVSIVTAP